MDEVRLGFFNDAYLAGLTKAASEGKCAWPAEQAHVVHRKMMDAIRERGFKSVNHDGPGFRYACKQLGIKHTRTAIEAYLRGE
jgi:hypothetical protein